MKLKNITIKLPTEIRTQASGMNKKDRKNFLALWTDVMVQQIMNKSRRARNITEDTTE